MCEVAVAYITLIVSVCVCVCLFVCVTVILPVAKHVVYRCHFNVLIRQVAASYGLGK